MKFTATSHFRESLDILSKNYSTIKDDICREFRGLTFEQIFAKNYVLKDSGVSKLLKIRIANTKRGGGKSAGFRVILIANNMDEEITFLIVFSKTGKHGRDNIERETVKMQIDLYKRERDSNMLLSLNIENNLEEILV